MLRPTDPQVQWTVQDLGQQQTIIEGLVTRTSCDERLVAKAT